MDFWNSTIYGITLLSWGTTILVVILTYSILLFLRSLILNRLRRFASKTSIDVDDLIQNLLERTKGYFFFVVALYAGTFAITLPAQLENAARSLAIVVGLIQVAFWTLALIDYLVERRVKREDGEVDARSETTWNALKLVLKISLWIIIALLILENITGIQVDSLIASLGITGVAVALAVQNILGDLFASLSIALDKPFVIGDFILVDDMMGTVEYIGLKSTRVRSIHGEQLVFSNNDLLSSRIRNLHGMERRRVVYPIGVTYGTTHDQLRKIPDLLREIVEAQELATFDRSHFKEFGAYSLNFETIFFVETPDYLPYMNILQEINLQVYDRFQQEGIEFAFPTQKILVEDEVVQTANA
jgi:small-conductance mechanosensitive channel